MIETRMRGGQKVYRARVRLANTDKSMTFSREVDAIAWEARIRHEACQNRFVKHKVTGLVEVGTLIDKYISVTEVTDTIRGQLNWWKRQIGHVLIEQVDQSLICECREKLRTEPYYRKDKPLKHSNATVNRYVAAISVVFSYGRDMGLMLFNPCSSVRKLKENRGRVRYLSADEIKRLFVAIEEMEHPTLGLVIMIALCSGARKMEILGLRWGDIEMMRQMLVFRHTKNGEVRYATLPAITWKLLMEYYQHQKPKSLSEYVFPSQNGKKPSYIRAAFKEALERAGIFDFRFHDLRHTAATYLQDMGANTNQLAEFLGHKTLSMVKRYAHVMPEYQRACLEKMEKRYCEYIPATTVNKYLVTG